MEGLIYRSEAIENVLDQMRQSKSVAAMHKRLLEIKAAVVDETQAQKYIEDTTKDMRKVVFCSECKYYKPSIFVKGGKREMICGRTGGFVCQTDYCSRGEMKE